MLFYKLCVIAFGLMASATGASAANHRRQVTNPQLRNTDACNACFDYCRGNDGAFGDASPGASRNCGRSCSREGACATTECNTCFDDCLQGAYTASGVSNSVTCFSSNNPCKQSFDTCYEECKTAGTCPTRPGAVGSV